MDRQQQILEILKLSGVPTARAKLLANLIDSLYDTLPRPDQALVKEKFDKAAADSMVYWTNTLGANVTKPVRQRIREVLFQFYLGLVTNGAWDAIKLFLTMFGTIFMAAEDQNVKELERNASSKQNDAVNHLPITVPRYFFSEMEEVWKSQLKYLNQMLCDDPVIKSFFEEQGISPDFISTAHRFYNVFELPVSSGGKEA